MGYTLRGLRRHKNGCSITGTGLTYPDHVSSSGICAMCTRDGFCEIGKKSRTGQTHFPQPFGTGQFGAEKIIPNIEDIQIIPELYGNSIIFSKVNTVTKLGGFTVKFPLVVAAMGSTKVAHDVGADLAAGAAKAGIPMVVGENVLQTHGENGLKARIQPYLDNYDGKHGAVIVQGNGIDIKNGVFELASKFGAHGIEVKLGQGAKQNLGGEIKFSDKKDKLKYEKLGYYIEENPDGTFQRHTDPGSLNFDELRYTLIKYKKLRLPIWIKIGIGRGILKLIKDLETIKRKDGVPIEALTIDGFGGGTGMSPWGIMNENGIPSGAVFSQIKRNISFDIILAGGYNSGIDMAKGIMMGAKGIAMGRAFLIATNVPKHVETIQKKLNLKASEGIVNFVKGVQEELRMICAVQRVNRVEELVGRRSNLFALSEEAAKMFGLHTDPKRVL